MYLDFTGNLVHLSQIDNSTSPVKMFELIQANRQEFQTYMPWTEKVSSFLDSKAYIQRCWKQFQQRKSFSFQILVNNEQVGMISTHEVNWKERTTALGYWLDKQAQGKGYVSEAVKLVTNYCLVDLRLKEVYIRAAAFNTKSNQVAIKNGFEFRCLLKDSELLNGKLHDQNVYVRSARYLST